MRSEETKATEAGGGQSGGEMEVANGRSQRALNGKQREKLEYEKHCCSL